MSSTELRFTGFRFTLSTADEERNVVTDLPTPPVSSRSISIQPGQYRVIDGSLCRVIGGLPPTWSRGGVRLIR
jgi:hypothetical protein